MPYVFALLFLAFSQLLYAEDLNQFSLASQSDWGAKKGFFLVLDNRYDGQPSQISRTRLLLAVGDGASWQIHLAPDTFQMGRTYKVKALIDGQQATLWLDGRQVQQFPTRFVPHSAQLFAFDHQDWARKPAEYLIVQRSLQINSAGKQTQYRLDGLSDPKRFLFSPGRAQVHDLDVSVPLTIEAEFEIFPYPSLRKLSPLVDRYGQVNFATWEGKVTSDDQLRQILTEEEAKLAEWEIGLPPQDAFGGRKDLGFSEPATGFFRVTKREGKWWLISPEGNPCFFTGVCNAPALNWDATPVTGREYMFEWLPPQDGVYKSVWGDNYWGDARTLYFAPQAANLIAQYGEGWQEKETARAIRRVKAWGFSGMGKWTVLPQQTQMPVLSRGGVPELVRHPDTFDPAIREKFRQVLQKQIAGREKDPYILGFSLGNEMDETFAPDEIRQILAQPAASTAKQAMIDFAARQWFAGNLPALAAAWKGQGDTIEQVAATKLTPRKEDVEPLRDFVADAYFAFVYQTVKELAPNHLYLGHWVLPCYWHNENDWRHVARHCDVVGFDLYEYSFNDEKTQKMIRESDKPVLCGEFSFPPAWNGDRGFGRFRTAVTDEAEYGRLYREWVKAASANAWCVGVNIFQYRDEPVTGRGPVRGAGPSALLGENYAFGLVDVTNRPRYQALIPMREANLQAPLWRLGKELVSTAQRQPGDK